MIRIIPAKGKTKIYKAPDKKGAYFRKKFKTINMSMLIKSPSRSIRRVTPYWNSFDNFFRNDLLDLWRNDFTETMPSVNIIENHNDYQVEMAAPGLKKEDFNINIENNLLTISCEKEKETKPDKDNKNYSRREYNYSFFSRSFTLPQNADTTNIKAKYNNGILILNVPKRDDEQKTSEKKIEIE